jgi:UDP-glucose 4-epimerase
MIILVGANGFLGRHTCELLERRGVPATVVSGTLDRRFLRRFAPSLGFMDAADFASPAGGELIARGRAIVYFTWRSVPATFASEPWREVREDVEPAFEFFQRVANISKNAKIVLLSSGGTVYGRDCTNPKTEMSPTNPMSAYGLGKLMAKKALSFVGRTKGAPYAILRVSNAIGRWQTSETQGIAGVALRAARDGVAVRLFGGGLQVRDFVDADDVAEAILAASADPMHPATTWNVGSGVGITIADLMHLLSQVIGRPIPFEQAPPRSMDVPHVVLDGRKVAQDLGWTATTPIEQSISSLWEAVRGA